ncbi:MAG: cytochrome C biogenesis protein, partial [Opitutales bacterium]
MKRLIPFLIVALGAAGLACTLLPPRNDTAFDLVGFGRLPVLADGRLKPLDTLARSSLLQLQGRQLVSDPAKSEPFVSTPTEWLVDVLFHPALADTFPT